jgi:hypothetical protein
VLDVVEELGAAADGWSAVREEEDLLVRLVPRLHRRAGVDGDDTARRHVDALRRVLDEERERAAERHEDLLLVRIDVPASARVRRVAPHPRARLRELCGIGDRGLAPRRLTVHGLALVPLEVGCLDDVEGHAATIPSARMARPTYPRAGEPRPAALPPETRTVGQVVAESIRIYGEKFVRCLAIGVVPAGLTLASAHVSRGLSLILTPTLYGALLSATFVYASTVVLERRPPLPRLVRAALAGWLVFIPAPFLLLGFILPALAWLAALGLVVPVLVVEDLRLRAALARAWQLARADYIHVLGSLATLAILVIITQGVLAFIIRGAAAEALETAFVLASVVISPLVFIGAALLYVDQTARVE